MAGKVKDLVSYKQKMDQANSEAKATVVALVVMVVAWIALGFGLANVDVTIFHTPLWVIGATLGVYVVSIVIVVVLKHFVFRNFDLDGEEANND